MNPPAAMAAHSAVIEQLNQDCYCISLDRDALRRELARDCSEEDADALIGGGVLFSPLPVFVSPRQIAVMAAAVAAVERVVALPAYRDAALAWAPPIARMEPRARGVFFGYDFHLSPAGPRLIEINPNAGGAMLNAALARAQRACCEDMEGLGAGPLDPDALDQAFFDMFLAEWRLERGPLPLATVVIADDAPQSQFLAAEFRLFARLFERRGVHAIVADPVDLACRDGRLWLKDRPIDLVYNRLTDFALAEPSHTALREAHERRLAVITPHPRAHALYADKRNLTLLSDPDALRRWGADESTINTLQAAVPHTVRVTPGTADALWACRRELFFKPAAGYGSKAAYRGDKLTRRVWNEILARDYVAQEFVAPGLRRLAPASDTLLKIDVRNYVYAGEVQLVTARLYQGQTTNFRTPNGGFATVFSTARRPAC